MQHTHIHVNIYVLMVVCMFLCDACRYVCMFACVYMSACCVGLCIHGILVYVYAHISHTYRYICVHNMYLCAYGGLFLHSGLPHGKSQDHSNSYICRGLLRMEEGVIFCFSGCSQEESAMRSRIAFLVWFLAADSDAVEEMQSFQKIHETPKTFKVSQYSIVPHSRSSIAQEPKQNFEDDVLNASTSRAKEGF